MAPLPCSPVSNSTASESHSIPTSDQDSDDSSLITPRPGPADPSQRTPANLSRPSVPYFATSPDSFRVLPDAGRARRPSTYGAAAAAAAPLRPSSTTAAPSSHTRSARDMGPASSTLAETRIIPTGNPPVQQDGRVRRAHGAEDVGESSADENTAIMYRARGVSRGSYGATGRDDSSEMLADDDAGKWNTPGPAVLRRKKSGRSTSEAREGSPRPGIGQEQRDEARSVLKTSWVQNFVSKYGSVELENKGSVARDHLALERTFLAWLRTSLSFASIGIAITQLFRLNTSLGSDSTAPAAKDRLRQVGKPLGATFIGIAVLILLLGFHRYFESQHYVIQGRFPASRGSIVFVSLVSSALIIASFVVVLAIAPNAFEG